LNNNNGYDKIKVANGIQQSYISFFWSGVCVICGRQIMRDNIEAESLEDYFRKSITVPFLYCSLNEMKTRFIN
jgi:hypothetical protein